MQGAMISGLGSALAARPWPVLASGLLHSVAFATLLARGVPAHAPKSADSEQLLTIETLENAQPTIPEEKPEAAPEPSPVQAHAAHAHEHPYPVPLSHAATPHDPSIDHHHDDPAPPEAAPPAAVAVAEQPREAPRFTMRLGTATARSGMGEARSGGAAPAEASGGHAEEVVDEASVAVPARLATSVTAAYPPEARANEMEAELPFEIVVDTQGAVVAVRPLKRAGFGFDEAAAAALRRYRFTPAQRGGHPVRVRMVWKVQFRLR